jgi:hypothetical protein
MSYDADDLSDPSYELLGEATPAASNARRA